MWEFCNFKELRLSFAKMLKKGANSSWWALNHWILRLPLTDAKYEAFRAANVQSGSWQKGCRESTPVSTKVADASIWWDSSTQITHQIQPLKMSLPVGRSPKIRPRILSTFSRGHFMSFPTIQQGVINFQNFEAGKFTNNPGPELRLHRDRLFGCYPQWTSCQLCCWNGWILKAHPKKSSTNSNSLAHAPPFFRKSHGFLRNSQEAKLDFWRARKPATLEPPGKRQPLKHLGSYPGGPSTEKKDFPSLVLDFFPITWPCSLHLKLSEFDFRWLGRKGVYQGNSTSLCVGLLNLCVNFNQDAPMYSAVFDVWICGDWS